MIFFSDNRKKTPRLVSPTAAAKVVSFEAPVVVVAAEDDGAKLNPTRKIIVYGGVEAQDPGSYTLQWDQVRHTIQARIARCFDPVLHPILCTCSKRINGFFVAFSLSFQDIPRQCFGGYLLFRNSFGLHLSHAQHKGHFGVGGIDELMHARLDILTVEYYHPSVAGSVHTCAARISPYVLPRWKATWI